MALDLEQLLQPIAADAPCGAELRYDATFHELEAAAESGFDYQRGPNGKEVARPRPRDWSKIGRDARALLVKGRDLRVQILLVRSLLATDRLAGLAQGLELVHRSLEDYWESLHPALDLEQPDPAEQAFERLSVLGQLTVGEELLTDLRRAPIIEAPALGSLSLRQIEIANGQAQAGSGEERLEPTQVEAILKTAGPERVGAARGGLATAKGALDGIQQLFRAKLGEGAVPIFTPLQQMLDDIDAALADHGAPEPVAGEPASAAAVTADLAAAPVAGAPAPATSAGAVLSRIDNREDVVRAFDLILDYYRRKEPSSPVPLLVERIKKLVRMSFLELMAEVAPAGVSEFKALAGLEGEDKG